MAKYGFRQIERKADEIITEAILETISEPSLDEEDTAKKALKVYNVYAEKIESPEIEADIPKGFQDLTGKVQTSNISNPTQSMALIRILEQEKRERYKAVVYAVDKGIHAASFRSKQVKKRAQLEQDIRRYFSLEVGRPKTDRKLLKSHIPYVYKAIAECLIAGGCWK